MSLTSGFREVQEESLNSLRSLPMCSGVLAANAAASDSRGRDSNGRIRFMTVREAGDSVMLQDTGSVFFFFHHFFLMNK